MTLEEMPYDELYALRKKWGEVAGDAIYGSPLFHEMMRRMNEIERVLNNRWENYREMHAKGLI